MRYRQLKKKRKKQQLEGSTEAWEDDEDNNATDEEEEEEEIIEQIDFEYPKDQSAKSSKVILGLTIARVNLKFNKGEASTRQIDYT